MEPAIEVRDALSGVSGLSGGLGSESDEEYYDDSQNAIIDLLFDILFATKSGHHQSDHL